MAVSTDKIVLAGYSLRENNTQLWDSFVEAIRHYSASHALELVRSHPDLLIKNQGYALALNELSVLLQQVPYKFDTIRASQIGRKP
jgi:hypothetical protein